MVEKKSTASKATKKASAPKKKTAAKKPVAKKTVPEFDGEIVLGMTGEAVDWIQSVVGCEATGVFDNRCKQHLQRWQSLNGLAPDGVMGIVTWQRMVNNSKN
jgi:murein L,D-transpeptidase YcbB/YkuD